MVRLFITIGFALLISACAVRFPQVERLVHELSEPSNPLDPILWVADINGKKEALIPLIAEQGNTYVNQKGVSLTFDGFIVTKIETFSEDIRHLEIRDTQQGQVITRQIWLDYRPVAKLRCDIWRVSGVNESTQRCDSEGSIFINRRELNADGEMVLLQQPLAVNGLVLQLKKKITNQ
jgi:hypothetical protein